MSDVLMYSNINKNILSSITNYADAKGYRKVFFLIDTMAGSVPIGNWKLEAGNDGYWNISDSANHDDSPLQLLCFNLEQQDIIKNLIVTAEDDKQCNAICGWLFSHKHGDDLQRHLSNILLLKHDSDDWLFRYYDPRVMSRLISILSNHQIDSLLGVIDSWHFLNRYKNEVVIEHSARYTVGDDLIKLNRMQWMKISNIEWFNLVLDAYSQFNPAPLTSAQESFLDAALIYTNQFNITEGQDILVFAQFGLIYGQGILANFEIKKMVKQAVENNKPLIEFFSEKSDEFWMTI
ncbi:DUF4123 domain-containing protein [Pragia fontium]|uniref:DUF4123 domain-containing protein n=1 Tax=Pragia fontium TaxID=82985 RepID=A0ABQ5LE07_9GAMM|nr:DUF4123 domain-containing protein [Pragia fontium]GKX61843.1 hypothetical protein SOASR032_04120 [Pragia fontium]SUB82361.1 Uncharacterised protein [Pragia fontium]VEJ55250.1 Uncharacterised protein [Pragia fontium]